MDLIKMTAKIKGVAPLMMNNLRKLDPLDPATKHLKEVTSKKKKTDADHAQIKWLDYAAGLYIDDRGPYVPSTWIESMIRDGARVNKRGKDIVAALFCDTDRFYLDYPGRQKTHTAEAMFAAGMVDTRGVVVARARTLRTRPCFPAWTLDFDVTINSAVLNAKDVEEAIANAGMIKGMGDYRPKFGRFILESIA